MDADRNQLSTSLEAAITNLERLWTYSYLKTFIVELLVWKEDAKTYYEVPFRKTIPIHLNERSWTVNINNFLWNLRALTTRNNDSNDISRWSWSIAIEMGDVAGSVASELTDNLHWK